MIEKKVLEYFKGRTYFVTGGTGLIGREVSLLLREAGAHVRIVSLDRVQLHKDIEYIHGDLTDFNFCLEQTKDVENVFHLAGIKGSVDVTIKRPASFCAASNVQHQYFRKFSRINKVQKLVYTSSIGAYQSSEIFIENNGDLDQGQPMDMYPGFLGQANGRASNLLYTSNKYGINSYSIVVLCNVYGPGDNFDPDNAMVIPTLMSRINNKENPVTVWGDGTAIRDFVFSRDVAEGVILHYIMEQMVVLLILAVEREFH